MAIDAALYAIMHGHAGTAALVSTRVYPAPLPEKVTLPAITYARMGGDREHAFGADPGNVTSRVQIDCWAADHDGARALETQVRTALSRYRGSAGGETIDDVFVSPPFDMYEPEKEIYRSMLLFNVMHREA